MWYRLIFRYPLIQSKWHSHPWEYVLCALWCVWFEMCLIYNWSNIEALWVVKFQFFNFILNAACSLHITVSILCAPAVHRNCKAVESQLMTERKAADWEAFQLGGTRPSWERGPVIALRRDCVNICIQTCTEYTYSYLQFCASCVVRVYRTSIWNRTAMQHVTLVPVALLAVVLGNLHIKLKPNKRHLQPHSKGRGVGTCHIPCKVLRRQE